VAIIGFAAIGIPIYASSTYGLNQDYAAFPMVTLMGLILTFLAILSIRLVFELVAAVIQIAESAKTRGLNKTNLFIR
jgi:hypothetical protein